LNTFRPPVLADDGLPGLLIALQTTLDERFDV
jgi:hypothetical protein